MCETNAFGERLMNTKTAIPAEMASVINTFYTNLYGEQTPPEDIEEIYHDIVSSIDVQPKPVWEAIEPHLEMARATEAYELYFGGIAGCGKSLLGAGIACTEHKNSIFFRTEYSQLKDIVRKTRDMLAGTGASFNGQTYMWTGIPGGRTLEFGGCLTMDDVEKFRGREHDLIVFDEVGTFYEDVYLSLQAWLRTADKNQRVRIIATGNPPASAEYYWVKRRWAAWVDDRHPNPAKPGEIRWFANIDGDDTEVDGSEPFLHKGERLIPQSRTFVPGVMLTSLKGTNYEATLQQLPEPMRSQLLYGDFSLIEDDQSRQVIPTRWVRLAQERWETMRQPNCRVTAVGVDVARGGKDSTVIAKRYKNYFSELLKYNASQCKTGPDVAALIIKSIENESTPQSVRIVIDLTGIGSSPYDILHTQRYNVTGFVGAGKSELFDKAGQLGFYNKRAEAWWKFREALDPDSGEDIALPPDTELLQDLTIPTWKMTTRGIQIEEKDAIIKRLGRSPDAGDAVVMNLNLDITPPIKPMLMGVVSHNVYR